MKETGIGAAVQAQLILASLLLALLPVTMVNIPLQLHAVTLDIWPPNVETWDMSEGPAVAQVAPPGSRRDVTGLHDWEPPYYRAPGTAPPRLHPIEIEPSGRILIDGRAIDLAGLGAALGRLERNGREWLHLLPHPEARYELVHAVLAEIGRADGHVILIDNRPYGAHLPAAPPRSRDAQAAAQVARDYFAAIGERRYEAAFRMLNEGAAPPGSDAEDFAAAFAEYADYRAEIGPPDRIEGAAGSLYVEVPARVSGRMKDGTAFEAAGVVLLRRCNDVPGCSAEQRRWRIEAENLRVE